MSGFVGIETLAYEAPTIVTSKGRKVEKAFHPKEWI